ncbi:hypothetical protein RSSM_02289 [Rhodopirellula sallentina SM41]|uniref:Uncharacterized protein n=2 Tax=Rhodopirellula TaxID=265488 RepID=M5U4A1_9BACT|nr:hypothetical protein RSSM_02289 [Rhodopirellula sallentina SM41]
MTKRPYARSPDFAKGEAIICGGIAFFIDPNDDKTLYAGSPSSDHSDARFALVAREAVRYLPVFLAEDKHPVPHIDDRRLVVRITDDYRGVFSDYTRAVELLPAPLSVGLGSIVSEHNQ